MSLMGKINWGQEDDWSNREKERLFDGEDLGYWAVDLWKPIRELKMGEKGWIEPFAIGFDINGLPYLDMTLGVSKNKCGEYQVPIIKMSEEPEDFDINIKNVDYKWIRSTTPYKNYPKEEKEILFVLSLGERLIRYGGIEADSEKHPRTYKLRVDLIENLKNERYILCASILDQINSVRGEELNRPRMKKRK